MTDQELQNALEALQNAVERLQNATDAISQGEYNTSIPDTAGVQNEVYELFTTAAITEVLRFEGPNGTVEFDDVDRIEQQSFLRGTAPNGDQVVVNLMNFDTVQTVSP